MGRSQNDVSPRRPAKPESVPSEASNLGALTNPERLRALRRYDVISASEEKLQRFPRLAAQLYDAPIAILTLLGDERQRFIAAFGTDLDGVPAKPSVCRATIQERGTTVVKNLAADERFADNHYVTGDLHLRFYAGAPLTTSDGHHIGTLCVYDVEPHASVPEAGRELQDLADMAIEQLERSQFSVDDRPVLTQTVLDHLPGIFYIVGDDSELLRWNGRFASLSGYSDEELDGRSAVDFFTGADHDAVAQAIRRVFETGSATVEAAFSTKDGASIPMLLTGVRADLQDATRLVGMGIDISERKKKERQLRRAKEDAEEAREEAQRQRERAEEASRSKSHFLRGVAHDLKNPASSITGFAQILRDELSGDHARHAESIYRAAHNVNDMAESLMDLARLGSGTLDLSVSPVHVDELLGALAENEEPKADASGLTIEVDADDVRARANASSLRRALGNLVENALAYGREGGRVDLRAYADEDAVVIEVADDGPGIEPDFLDRLFEPFARNAPDTDGTGLGLAVTKELVEAMNGTIGVDSEVGEGTRFRIRLPEADA